MKMKKLEKNFLEKKKTEKEKVHTPKTIPWSCNKQYLQNNNLVAILAFHLII